MIIMSNDKVIPVECEGCCYRRDCDFDLGKCCYLSNGRCLINEYSENYLFKF